jgi:hypothetical protein
MECSAKSGQSVEQVFMELGRMMKEKVIDEATKEQGVSLGTGQEGSRCCGLGEGAWV